MKKIKKVFTILLTLSILFSSATVFAAKNQGYKFPIPGLSRISQYYSSGHPAVDIAANEWTPIYAIKAGTIDKVYTGCTNVGGYGSGGVSCSSRGQCNPNHGTYNGYCNNGSGNGIIIRHEGNIWSEYSHMVSVADGVYEGQWVEQGTLIGYVGNTGSSAGNHCHFAMKSGGNSNYWRNTGINPLDYMDTDDGGSGGGNGNGGDESYIAYVSGTDGNLAINSSPNAYSQVGTIPEGATCTVYPNQGSGNWLWVTYNGISGYSYNKYLIKTDNPAPPTDNSSGGNGERTYTARVAGTDGNLAINSSPNAYSQVGVIPEGATCTVYPNQASGNWLWVTYNGISGYSYNRYLIEVSNEAVVSTPEPTPVPTPEPTPVPTPIPTPKPTPTPTVKPTPTPNIDDYNKGDYQPSVLTVFSGNKLQIAVDDTLVRFPDAQPFIDSNDRTQVPIRAVSEMLDCDVEWISETHTAIITRENGDTIIIVIGSNTMLVNNNKVKMDTAALIKDDRTYIPVRFVAEALGLTVEWE